MAVVGRISGTNLFGDIGRHPENEVVPGVFIYRIDSPLIFANAENFKENFSKALGQEQRPIHLAIIDLEFSPFMDVTAVEMILELITELDQKGIALRLANASGRARDVLRAAGIEEKIGKLDQATTIAVLLEQNKNAH
jgi:anti-anti-sigma factor